MRGARGFTLIEVLVALAILSIVMLALLRLMTVDGATAVQIEDRLAAEIVAENAAVDAMVEPGAPDLGVETGSTNLDGRVWEWTRTTVETGIPGLVRIEIAVQLEDGRQTLASRTLVRTRVP